MFRKKNRVSYDYDFVKYLLDKLGSHLDYLNSLSSSPCISVRESDVIYGQVQTVVFVQDLIRRYIRGQR